MQKPDEPIEKKKCLRRDYESKPDLILILNCLMNTNETGHRTHKSNFKINSFFKST